MNEYVSANVKGTNVVLDSNEFTATTDGYLLAVAKNGMVGIKMSDSQGNELNTFIFDETTGNYFTGQPTFIRKGRKLQVTQTSGNATAIFYPLTN